ncbi:hypothetical protein OM076_04175 [Solirubrobacter ginsenosidimutans]|uniref:Uncharacterized protein n=1 Tax=Solirubrobacter ginsenosidimutans TaxID=490573 RepID=A0A9X3S0S6_9ACTN|nr:hypothetical protein [Solirubrobacter ginsenosidimutans]MDA0159451.1 hypothetical protein [Solirubrobacter ginsenosidimutans]
MSEYERATTSMTFGSLPEPIRAAVRAKAESLQLTVADDAPAFLTHSRKLKRSGMLNRMLGGDQDKAHDTALVIGAKDVLVATHGEKRGTAVLAARLDDTDVSAMSERLSELSGISADDGMSVNGFPVSGTEGNGRGSFYVGLGPPEGAAARTALIEAIRAAKA